MQESDKRLGRTFRVLDSKGSDLGEWTLKSKIGPGHFQAQSGSRTMEVFSSQLRGST